MQDGLPSRHILHGRYRSPYTGSTLPYFLLLSFLLRSKGLLLLLLGCLSFLSHLLRSLLRLHLHYFLAQCDFFFLIAEKYGVYLAHIGLHLLLGILVVVKLALKISKLASELFVFLCEFLYLSFHLFILLAHGLFLVLKIDEILRAILSHFFIDGFNLGFMVS